MLGSLRTPGKSRAASKSSCSRQGSCWPVPAQGLRPAPRGSLPKTCSAMPTLPANNAITGLFGTFTGGAFNNFAVFSLGIMPYITAAIVMQLMTVAIPRLREARPRGPGRASRDHSVHPLLHAGSGVGPERCHGVLLPVGPGRRGARRDRPVKILVAILTLTTGVMLTMWLGELISQRGLGNGISLIITASILSQAPLSPSGRSWKGRRARHGGLALLAIMIIAAIVFVNEGQRRIPRITYAKRQVGQDEPGRDGVSAPEGQHGRGYPYNLRLVALALPRGAGPARRGRRPGLFPCSVALFFDPSNAPYLILYAMLIIMFTTSTRRSSSTPSSTPTTSRRAAATSPASARASLTVST